MVIEKVTGRHSSDIFAKFRCEHCGSLSEGRGYDDGFYRQNVLPFCQCPSCGLQSIKGKVRVSYDGFKLIEKKELPDGYAPPESYYSGEPQEEGWKEEDRHPDWPCLW